MDRIQVLERLQPISQSDVRKVDHGGDAKVLVADDTAAMKLTKNSRSIPFSSEGLGNLLNFSGVPVAMSSRLTHDTRAKVINELLSKKRQYSVVVKDKEIHDLIPNGKSNIPVNSDRLLKTLDRTAPGVNYNRVMITGTSAVIEMACERHDIVAKGDLIQAGAAVRFSPVGFGAPAVQSYTLRALCTNGMTTQDIFREYGYGEGDDIWQFFRESVKEAIGAVAGIVNRYQEMVKDRIAPNDRALIIEALIKNARLPDRVAEAVRARAIAEPPRNAYEAMNMLTYASSHDLERPEEVMRAQKAAARFAHEKSHARICPACQKNR